MSRFLVVVIIASLAGTALAEDGDTCGANHTCATANYILNPAKDAETVLDDATCCYATCAAYTCATTGWVAIASAVGKAPAGEATCCEATCAAYTCTTTGWVAIAKAVGKTSPVEATCCEAPQLPANESQACFVDCPNFSNAVQYMDQAGGSPGQNRANFPEGSSSPCERGAEGAFAQQRWCPWMENWYSSKCTSDCWGQAKTDVETMFTCCKVGTTTAKPVAVITTTRLWERLTTKYQGTLTFVVGTTVTKTQVETATRKTLARELDLEVNQITTTATESRRLLDADAPLRRLAGSWSVAFTATAPMAQSSNVQVKFNAMSKVHPTSEFTAEMAIQLKAAGASDAALKTFEMKSFETVTTDWIGTEVSSSRHGLSARSSIVVSLFFIAIVGISAN